MDTVARWEELFGVQTEAKELKKLLQILADFSDLFFFLGKKFASKKEPIMPKTIFHIN